MLTSDLVPCFVQALGEGTKTGYEKALLVGVFDKTFTDLDRCISSSNRMAGPTRKPVAVVMRTNGRLQEVELWKVVIDDSEEVPSPSTRVFASGSEVEKIAAGIMAGLLASSDAVNRALENAARNVRRLARLMAKRNDPKWRRARARALRCSRRNVEALKREGRRR